MIKCRLHGKYERRIYRWYMIKCGIARSVTCVDMASKVESNEVRGEAHKTKRV